MEGWSFLGPRVRRNRDLLFNVHMLSVLEDKKVLETDILLAIGLFLG